MATITLTKTFLNRLPDGAFVAYQTRVGRGLGLDAGGEVRTYAGGRRRNFTRTGVASTVEITFAEVDATGVSTLQDWVNTPVQVRTDRGLCLVGVYHSVTFDELRLGGLNLWDAHLSVISITAPDEVT